MSNSKWIHIYRHGKATNDYAGISDFNRPLKVIGIINSYSTAKALKKINVPTLLISSPAIRALHSAIITAEVLNYPVEDILLKKELYLAESETIIEVIESLDNNCQSVVIFGHNPGFSDLAGQLSNKYIGDIPTAGCVSLQFSIDNWTDIKSQKSVQSFTIFPE